MTVSYWSSHNLKTAHAAYGIAQTLQAALSLLLNKGRARCPFDFDRPRSMTPLCALTSGGLILGLNS